MTSFTVSMIDVVIAAQNIRKIVPDTHICLGGHHPIAFPFEAASLPEFDSVVVGEGEIVFTELVKDTNWYKGEGGGGMVSRPSLAYFSNTYTSISPTSSESVRHWPCIPDSVYGVEIDEPWERDPTNRREGEDLWMIFWAVFSVFGSFWQFDEPTRRTFLPFSTIRWTYQQHFSTFLIVFRTYAADTDSTFYLFLDFWCRYRHHFLTFLTGSHISCADIDSTFYPFLEVWCTYQAYFSPTFDSFDEFWNFVCRYRQHFLPIFCSLM